MTENEAIAKMKHRLEIAYRIVGKGVDGKACEDMEMAIKALEEIQAYRAIGTVEEFKALKEKSEPKKIVNYEKDYKCPICNHWVGFRFGYCDACGQKLDWGKE